MMKESKPNFFSKLEDSLKKGLLPEKQYQILKGFFIEYQKAAEKTASEEQIQYIFKTLLKHTVEQVENPHSFGPYHQKVRSPFDYYAFGLDFIEPLIDKPRCKILGLEHVKEMMEALKRKENVILLANHQTEPDPQIIDFLLQDSFPEFGANIIYVAGERVITDPAAIPFSLGRDLLCIYSKKYIDHPPELKEKKQLHNNRAMKLMSELLAEGGKTIYVAPSGGRDRKNSHGVVEVAPFDPQSVEMFYLMAKRAGRPTHFYPLALVTYDLAPPPDTIQKELGEMRYVRFCPVHLAFGEKIDMEKASGGNGTKDKTTLRKHRADFIWQKVKTLYEELSS